MTSLPVFLLKIHTSSAITVRFLSFLTPGFVFFPLPPMQRPGTSMKVEEGKLCIVDAWMGAKSMSTSRRLGCAVEAQ